MQRYPGSREGHGWRTLARAALAPAVLGLVLFTPGHRSALAQVPPGRDVSDRLYAASIAAAEAALRLHETDRMVRWLEEAPADRRGWEWQFLKAQSDQSASSLALGLGTITDISVSPDGSTAAVAGSDSTAAILDAATGRVKHLLRGHSAAVWTPTFSSDGKRLATASSDGSVRVWDVASGGELLVFRGNGRGVAEVAWSPDDGQLAVGSWDRTPERGVWGTLNVWDAVTGQPVRRLEHGGYPIGSVMYSRDGRWLMGATWDGNLLFWDTRTWADPAVVLPPQSPDYKRANDFDLSPDGERLAVAYADGRVRIWDLATREVVMTLTVPGEATRVLNGVAYLPHGTRLATVGEDLTLRIWDTSTGKQLGVFHGHVRAIQTVVAGLDGTRLFTGGSDGTFRIWNLDRLDPARTTWRPPHTAYALAFDPEQDRAVITTWQGWVRIIDARTGQEVRAWQAHESSGVGVDWSRDGRWIASSGNDGRVVLWNAATGSLVRELEKRSGQILSVAFSPDGSLVAAPGVDGTVKIWRVPSGEVAGTLSGGSTRSVGSVAWSPDGRSLAAGSGDGLVRIWDVRRMALVHRLEQGGSGTVALSFHPDGSRIAVGVGRTVKVWDVADGREVAEFGPAVSSILCLAYSPDGRRMVVGVGNQTFEIWSSRTGEMLLRLPQNGASWSATWTRADDLVLIPLDQTIRVLRPAADFSTGEK